MAALQFEPQGQYWIEYLYLLLVTPPYMAAANFVVITNGGGARSLEQPISTNSVPRAFFPRVAIGCRLLGGVLICGYMRWYSVNKRYGIWINIYRSVEREVTKRVILTLFVYITFYSRLDILWDTYTYRRAYCRVVQGTIPNFCLDPLYSTRLHLSVTLDCGSSSLLPRDSHQDSLYVHEL